MDYDVPSDGESLRELAEQKAKEWQHLQDLRAQTLESNIKHKETLLNEERAKFLKLKDDFKYNIQLLADRDEDLDRCELMIRDMRRELAEASSESSELKVHIADLNDKLQAERHLVEEAQTRYQQRLREKQFEFEEYRIAKDLEVQKERDEIEIVKRKLERQLTDIEGELELQKRELGLGFDEAMKKREHEFQVKRDEMSNELLAAQLKAKLLEREVEIMKNAQQETKEEFSQVAENHRLLEKQLKEKTWEIKDVSAMKDARIRDLEREVEKAQMSLTRIREDYERKHENLDKHCREQEQVSDALRQARDDSERHLHDQIHQLEEKLNDKDIEIRNTEWRNKDTLEDKDRIIQQLRDEVHQIKSDWDRHVSDLSKDTVQRDVQLQNAIADVDKLKGDLEYRKADIERYKRELSLAVDREAKLEKAKAQLHLDWSRKYEDVERDQYSKMEALIQKLTTSRDEALADVRQKEADLAHQIKLSQMLIRERDQALATLKHHGFSLDNSIQLESNELLSVNAQRELDNLKQQNVKLKSVISLMREEMEQLGTHTKHKESPHKEHVAVILDRDSEYVKNLEDEVQKLRCQSRGVDIETKQVAGVEDEVRKVDTQIGDNQLIRSHIQGLNDQIGSLRRDKVEYAAQIKKYQMQIQHLEALSNQLSEEPRKKQVEIDQLKYEIGAQTRRHESEVTSLRHQLSQLQLEVAQTRQEADEYYKGTLERNLEATSLGNQVSSLKMRLAQQQPNIAFGGQELLIQQLQDQISDLRQRHPAASQPDTDNEHAQLKQKLRQAALYIQQLAKEKQQLIEVGNRLRAELLKAGIKLPLAPAKPSVKIAVPPESPPPTTIQHPPPSTGPTGHSPPVKPHTAMSNIINNKLEQLEKLQYNLTKEELSFAHKGKQSVHIQASTESSGDSNEVPSSYPVNLGGTGSSVRTQLTSSPTYITDPRHSLGISLSSVGGESLQDLWRMVDEGPSDLTARLDNTKIPPETDRNLPEPAAWVVKGQNTNLGSKTLHKPILSAKTQGKLQKAKQKTKIRNYNLKD